MISDSDVLTFDRDTGPEGHARQAMVVLLKIVAVFCVWTGLAGLVFMLQRAFYKLRRR